MTSESKKLEKEIALLQKKVDKLKHAWEPPYMEFDEQDSGNECLNISVDPALDSVQFREYMRLCIISWSARAFCGFDPDYSGFDRYQPTVGQKNNTPGYIFWLGGLRVLPVECHTVEQAEAVSEMVKPFIPKE